VRWLAWLDQKYSQGYEVSEYEAAHRLTEFRLSNKYYKGLAYEPISASGPNGGKPSIVATAFVYSIFRF
jgi:Xaa-Pro aminopeptidase